MMLTFAILSILLFYGAAIIYIPPDPHALQPVNWVGIYIAKSFITYPHDNSLFTQGLAYSPDGSLAYESTGLFGRSTVHIYTASNFSHISTHHLDVSVFGEDITFSSNNTLLQLSYISHIIIEYDLSLEKSRLLLLPSHFKSLSTGPSITLKETWGIASFADRLIISDGSSSLYLLFYPTLKPIGYIITEVQGLNALEIVNFPFLSNSPLLLANIYKTDCIAILSPDTGVLVGVIIANLWHDNPSPFLNLLNGIAFHSGHLLLTGKHYPLLYDVRISKTNYTDNWRSHCPIAEPTVDDMINQVQ